MPRRGPAHRQPRPLDLRSTEMRWLCDASLKELKDMLDQCGSKPLEERDTVTLKWVEVERETGHVQRVDHSRLVVPFSRQTRPRQGKFPEVQTVYACNPRNRKDWWEIRFENGEHTSTRRQDKPPP